MKLLLENWRKYLNEEDLPPGEWVEIDLATLEPEKLERVWTMYSNTYLNMGMDLSASGASGLMKYKGVFLIDVDSPPDGISDAFILYKPTSFGNKIALLGTCQVEDCKAKRDAARSVVKKMFELLKGGGYFIEAGMKIEEILKKSDVPYVCDEEAIRAFTGEKFVEMLDDCYYKRKLAMAAPIVTKRIYGSFE
jgi:hypothetical protein